MVIKAYRLSVHQANAIFGNVLWEIGKWSLFMWQMGRWFLLFTEIIRWCLSMWQIDRWFILLCQIGRWSLFMWQMIYFSCRQEDSWKIYKKYIKKFVKHLKKIWASCLTVDVSMSYDIFWVTSSNLVLVVYEKICLNHRVLLSKSPSLQQKKV